MHMSVYIYICIFQFMYIYLRASGSGRRPQRRMARLQISGHYAYPAISQRLDPSAALLSSSDRSRLAALNVMLTPVLSLDSAVYSRGSRGGAKGVQGVQRLCNQP